MFTTIHRSVRPALTVAMGVVAFQLSLSTAAGQAVAVANPDNTTVTPALMLDRALTLMRDARYVEARDLLDAVIRKEIESGNSGYLLERAYDLGNQAREAIKSMDPVELSLQKAELGLSICDLIQVEKHARGVLDADAATPDQARRAEELLARLDRARGEMALRLGSMIESAERDFRAGKYASAKETFAAVRRSGVNLTSSQERVVAACEQRIVALEEAQGRSFTPVVSLAMFQEGQQEGVVRPRTEEQGQPETPQPEAQPEQPAAQPEAQPAQPEQPAGNIIDQANQLEAQKLIAQGDRAMQEHQYNTAIQKYTTALDTYGAYLTPEQRQHAEARRTEAQLALRGPAGDDTIQQRALVHDRILAEFNNSVQRANRAIAEGAPIEAESAYRQAQISLSEGQQRQVLSQADVESMTTRLQTIDRAITDLRLRLERQAQAELDAQNARAASEAAREAQLTRQRQVNEYLTQARNYQAELKYEEALETINRLLFIDPNNPAGLVLKEIYQDIIFFRNYHYMKSDKEFNFAHLRVENERASVPPQNIMNFPTNWRSISLKRGLPSAFRDTPENAAVLAQLESPKNRLASVQFTDNRLADVINYLESVTQLNVQPNWNRLADVGIEQETPVSLNLRNVTVETLLNRIVETLTEDRFNKPGWGIRDGMVIFSSDQDIRSYTPMHIYDISDLLHEVLDFTEVPELDLQSVLQSSRGGSGQSPFRDNQQQQGQFDEERRTLEEKIDEITNLLIELVDFEGWVENGGETGKIYPYQRNLVIVNTPANHRQIDGLLSKLRAQRAMQINVETRFLLVNQDFFEQIGFDIDVYLNANNNQFRATQAVDPTALPSDRFDFSQPGGILRSSTGAAFDPTGAAGQTTVGQVNPRSWSPIGFGSDSLGLASGLAPSTGFAATVLGGAPALGVAGQFVDDIQVDFLVRATQADRRSTQLTAPRLTFTNGQVSNIYVATQRGFVSDLQPVVGDSAVGFDPTVDTVAEGVTMLVEGTISADRRYVTLTIDTAVARIDDLAQQPVTAVAGGQLVNSADTQSFIQLPTVTVTRVRTTVNVPDQGTLLLGGQRLVTEFQVETGVPVLSKLPILNRFFTNRIEAKEEQTLLILVKPTVLIQAEQEENQYPGLADEIGLGG